MQEYDRDNITGIPFISKWLKTSLVVGLFLMYPTIIKNLLQIINCTEIDGKYYLTKDFNIECYVGQHYNFLLAAYIFIIIYGLGIPLGAFYFLFRYFVIFIVFVMSISKSMVHVTFIHFYMYLHNPTKLW